MKISYLEVFSVSISLLTFRLGIRQKAAIWPLNICSTVISIGVYYPRALYGACLASLLSILIDFYGWYRWGRGHTGRAGLKITRISWGMGVFAALVGVTGTFVLHVVLRHFHSSLPLLEAIRTMFMLIALWMTANKKLESYVLWFALNIVSLSMFYQRGMGAHVFKYAVYLYLSVQGYRAWRTAYLRQKRPKNALN